ncbi:MAG: hypothetical protein IJE91_04740 [Clostridia bacterium]|nr:hypothetical protein [Clostridia bacterium]
MEKVTIVINGVGGCGKDSLINCLEGTYKVHNKSSIDPVKDVAKHCGWAGDKSDKTRKFLSDLKRLMTDYNEFPLQFLLAEQDVFLNGDFDLMFVHIREPEEIAKFVKHSKTTTKTLLIKPRKELQGKVYGNTSDDDVENYDYDFIFYNDKPLEEVTPLFIEFISKNILNK